MRLPQPKGGGKRLQLLEIQDEPAVTIAVTNEPVVQGQLTTLVLPPPNEPGVQGGRDSGCDHAGG